MVKWVTLYIRYQFIENSRWKNMLINTVGIPSAKSKLWDSLQEKSDFLKIKITRTTGIAKKWRKNLDLQRLKRHFNY